MQPRTKKGQQSKDHLLATALDTFASLGYKDSSMRAIAQRAGVALSHAYYYFDSKEDIVKELLLQLREQQYESCHELLSQGNTLETNIKIAFTTTTQVLGPYHGFGPTFLKVLISSRQDATHNDLGQDLEQDLWQQVVNESRPLPPLGIRRDLPRFLLLFSRLLFSLWAYDSSPEQKRSRALMSRAAPVAAKFAVLSRLPVVRSLFDDLLGLMDASTVDSSEPAGQLAVFPVRTKAS